MGLAGGLATNGQIASGGTGGGGAGGGVFPTVAAAYHPQLLTSTQAPGTGAVCGTRTFIPKTGTLHDLAIPVSTASGNIRLGIYDIGVASGSVRTLLWDSGSVVASAANLWQVVGDPALAVTAGQQLDFVMQADNGTFAYKTAAGTSASASNQLPANFLPGGTVSPILGWFIAGTFGPLPATIGNTVTAGGNPTLIIGRIV